jgi:hypothetical protein
MSLIQIYIPGNKKKEAFATAITNETREILKVRLRQYVIITYNQRPSENCNISGEQP